jgi:hypothetical protein
MLVHIYAQTEFGELNLLTGPRDDSKGIEGYHVDVIRRYNELGNALGTSAPLSSHPSIMDMPPLFNNNIDTSQLLVFWAHVACFHDHDEIKNAVCWQFDDLESEEWHEKYNAKPVEVVLIAVSFATPGSGTGSEDWYGQYDKSVSNTDGDLYHGVVVERVQGVFRRIGVIHDMTGITWFHRGTPKKELVFMM